MRTIKFRGKSVDYGTWRYGSLIIHEDGSMAITGGANEFSSQLWSSQVHPKSVGQWTGMVDKNGVEIYEGDILKMHQFLFDGNEYEKETIGVIKWGEYGWLLSQIDGKEVNEYMGYKNGEGETYLIHFYGLHEESFEIIANIHDNPELMGVE